MGSQSITKENTASTMLSGSVDCLSRFWSQNPSKHGGALKRIRRAELLHSMSDSRD